MGTKRRLSEVGIYHVYLRGNSKNIIFYDNEDRIQFCQRLNKFALIYNAKIFAYVLMGNHIHLLVKINNLSRFIASLLQSYVCWYNRKYKLSDRLCKSPFNSSPKTSIEKIKSSLIYIIQNPVKARICSNPFEYEWSSAKEYFNAKKHSKYVLIDKVFVEEIFYSKNEFLEEVLSSNIADQEIREKEDMWVRISHSELCTEFTKILNSRLLSSLTKMELKEISGILTETTNASYAQIASLLHVSYDFVRMSKVFVGNR